MANLMSLNTALAQPHSRLRVQSCRVFSFAVKPPRRQAIRCRATDDDIPAAFRPSTSVASSTDSPKDGSLKTEASTPPAIPDTPERRKRAAELVLGCRTILKELSGLDFPPSEVLLYMTASTKAPRGFAAALLPRARDALQSIVKAEAAADLSGSISRDVEGLELAQAMMSDLWRWRRKGGGMDYDEEESRPHKSALEELQNMKPADIDRVQSSLLDSLPISDKEKAEMSGSVQQAVVGGIQGAVWGSLAACIFFLILFNFLRST